MERNGADQAERETAKVVPLHAGERVYYVETVVMVPHKFMVAVPAPNTDAACQLAGDIIRSSKAYGIPDFQEREAIRVTAITSEGPNDRAGATRFEPVPDKYKAKRVIAGVSL